MLSTWSDYPAVYFYYVLLLNEGCRTSAEEAFSSVFYDSVDEFAVGNLCQHETICEALEIDLDAYIDFFS